MEIVAEARNGIGTPYRHQGSLKGVACDCIGLVRGVWRALYRRGAGDGAGLFARLGRGLRAGDTGGGRNPAHDPGAGHAGRRPSSPPPSPATSCSSAGSRACRRSTPPSWSRSDRDGRSAAASSMPMTPPRRSPRSTSRRNGASGSSPPTAFHFLVPVRYLSVIFMAVLVHALQEAGSAERATGIRHKKKNFIKKKKKKKIFFFFFFLRPTAEGLSDDDAGPLRGRAAVGSIFGPVGAILGRAPAPPPDMRSTSGCSAGGRHGKARGWRPPISRPRPRATHRPHARPGAAPAARSSGQPASKRR